MLRAVALLVQPDSDLSWLSMRRMLCHRGNFRETLSTLARWVTVSAVAEHLNIPGAMNIFFGTLETLGVLTIH